MSAFFARRSVVKWAERLTTAISRTSILMLSERRVALNWIEKIVDDRHILNSQHYRGFYANIINVGDSCCSLAAKNNFSSNFKSIFFTNIDRKVSSGDVEWDENEHLLLLHCHWLVFLLKSLHELWKTRTKFSYKILNTRHIFLTEDKSKIK